MDRAPSTTRRRRRRLAGLALFVVLLSSSVGASVLSLALFTAQESVGAAVTVGTISLDGVKVDDLTLTTPAIMPGQSVTDDVVIENDGTAQLRYSMTSSSTNADGLGLRAALTLTIKTIDVTSPGSPCNDFDGSTTLYDQALGASAAAFGDPSPGAQGGDRTLDAATGETLCFRLTLPSDTDNGSQGATTSITFTFDAEQTYGNP